MERSVQGATTLPQGATTLPQGATTLPDESTFRAWDDMRSEVLHELQDGADMPDAVMDITSELAVMLSTWWSMRAPLSSKHLS